MRTVNKVKPPATAVGGNGGSGRRVGHWRQLRSDKFTKKQGQVIWIPQRSGR